jgi:zinc transport system substrate-binding protein
MSRRAALAVTVLLAATATSGCTAFGDDGGDGTSDGLQVAAAFYPLQFVTERVAGGHAEVTNLTKPGAEPHDLELTIRENATIAQADLVVVEHDFQPAVDDAVEQNATGEVLDAAEVVGLQPFADHGDEHAEDEHAEDEHADDEHADDEHAEDEGHHEDDGHDHDGELDPHFWLDPVRVATLADAVADALADLDPDHADDYAANAAALRADLEDLDRAYAEGLASCERDTIVVSHDAFGYLGKYGLEVAPVAGLSPDAEPTAAVLADLQDLIREDGITTVFSEQLASPKFTESLARDTGVGTAVLDPIEGLTSADDDADYLSIMRDNLAALSDANGCS